MKSSPNGAFRPALQIQSIDITRTEGIAQPFHLDEFGPGINLIHGPNGIGKSQTAAAIRATIWPDRSTPRSELFARLKLDEDVWTIDVDGQHARYQRNGSTSGPLALSSNPASQSDRYLLTLHDLLSANNRDFARTIRNEAAGGYDLNAIRQHMRMGSRPKPQATRSNRVYRDARATVEELRRQDRQLQEEERSLRILKEDLDRSVAAAQTVRMLELAREHVDANENLRDAEVQRAVFKDPIGSMRGDEHSDVTTRQAELDDALGNRQKIELELARLRRELEATGFGDRVLSSANVDELRARLADLREREGDIRRGRETIASLEARLDANRKRIGEDLTDEQLHALDSEGLKRLSEMTRQVHAAEAMEYAESELLSWLGTTNSPHDLDVLLKGTDILQQRLRIGDGESVSPDVRVKWGLLASAVVIGLESVLLAVMVTPALGLIAVVAVPLVWMALRTEANPARTIIDNLRGEYGHLGLEAPADWTPQEVRPLLDVIQERLALARLEQQKAERWAGLAGRREQAAAKVRELNEQRAGLLQALGVVPKDADPETLRQIADALDLWRAVNDDVAAQRARIVESQQMFASDLCEFNAILDRAGAGCVTSVPEANAVVEDLAERVTKAENVRMQIITSERQRDEQVQPLVDRLQQQIDEVYRAHGLNTGDVFALSALCEQVKPCRDAQQRVDRARNALEAARARLADAPDYLTKTREEIEREIIHAQDLSSKQKDIQERISDIGAQLQQARRRTELEEAVASEASALDSLHDSREQDYANIAGWNLLEFVQGQHQMLNRPAVLDAADELFSAFTSGTYRLDVGEEGQPEFRAVDTTTHRGLGLEELSSGTRVQLLLAVRLAFIQRSEEGPRLPIMLDETLGNTDDIRAGAIIDAAIEISRRGRQLFYFTAQSDEIAKWQSRIARHPELPPCQTIDLGKARGKAGADKQSHISWDPSRFHADPIPDEVDYYTARNVLNVPPLDLRADHIDDVHLWYLITDMQALRTLHSRAIRRWGQYQQLYRGGSLPPVGPEVVHTLAGVRAKVVETVQTSWQYGRPRPISRQELRDCDLITDTFFDRVARLSAELEGDCKALIQALRDGKIARFRSDVTDKLEEFFLEAGYITDVQPFPDEIIYARAMASAQKEIDAGMITESEIAALLKSLGTNSPDENVVVEEMSLSYD